MIKKEGEKGEIVGALRNYIPTLFTGICFWFAHKKQNNYDILCVWAKELFEWFS